MGPNAQLDVNLRRPISHPYPTPEHVSWPECLKKLLEGSLGLHVESQTWLKEEEKYHTVWGTKIIALKEESGRYTSSLLLEEKRPSGVPRGTRRLSVDHPPASHSSPPTSSQNP